jgi:hypothetical protein
MRALVFPLNCPSVERAGILIIGSCREAAAPPLLKRKRDNQDRTHTVTSRQDWSTAIAVLSFRGENKMNKL